MGEEQTTAVVQRYLNALAEDSSARRKDRPLRWGYFCRSWQKAGYPPISPPSSLTASTLLWMVIIFSTTDFRPGHARPGPVGSPGHAPQPGI